MRNPPARRLALLAGLLALATSPACGRGKPAPGGAPVPERARRPDLGRHPPLRPPADVRLREGRRPPRSMPSGRTPSSSRRPGRTSPSRSRPTRRSSPASSREATASSTTRATGSRPSDPTLAALLKKAGYATGGAISAAVLASQSGISRGFDFYDERVQARGARLDARLRRAPRRTKPPALLLGWIRQNAARPFFAFLHTYEPHAPYAGAGAVPVAVRRPVRRRGRGLGRDRRAFLDELRKDGLYDRALDPLPLRPRRGARRPRGTAARDLPLPRVDPGAAPRQAARAGPRRDRPSALRSSSRTSSRRSATSSASSGFPERPGTVSLAALAAGSARPRAPHLRGELQPADPARVERAALPRLGAAPVHRGADARSSTTS